MEEKGGGEETVHGGEEVEEDDDDEGGQDVEEDADEHDKEEEDDDDEDNEGDEISSSQEIFASGDTCKRCVCVLTACCVRKYEISESICSRMSTSVLHCAIPTKISAGIVDRPMVTGM